MGMVQIFCQERTKEQIVDDHLPQVVIDTVVVQIVDVPVLQFQEGIAEELVDSTVRSVKALVEVLHLRPQERIHEHTC